MIATSPPGDPIVDVEQGDGASRRRFVDLERLHEVRDRKLCVGAAGLVVPLSGHARRGDEVGEVVLRSVAVGERGQSEHDAVTLARGRPAQESL